jgi:hypothetical protein
MSEVQMEAVVPVVEKKKRGRARGVPMVPLATLLTVAIAKRLSGVKSPDEIAEVAVNRTPKGVDGQVASLSGRGVIQRLFGKAFSADQIAQVDGIVAKISAKHPKASGLVKWVDFPYEDGKGNPVVGKSLDAATMGFTAPARKTNVDLTALDDLFAEIETDETDESEDESDS